KIKDEKPARRLRFYFDYLNHAEAEIANDALREFTYSDYKDYRAVAARLPGERIATWLRDPKTPRDRLGMLARLLGHCSTNKAQDAKLLRKLLNDPRQPAIPEVLEGLVLLQPKEGWKDVRRLLESPDSSRRFDALRVVRSLKEDWPELVSPQELSNAVALL